MESRNVNKCDHLVLNYVDIQDNIAYQIYIQIGKSHHIKVLLTYSYTHSLRQRLQPYFTDGSSNKT